MRKSYGPSTAALVALTARVAVLEAAGPAGAAFPVGSIYTNITGVDPATELGYGTWSAIAEGRMLIGVSSGDSMFNVPGETGGTINYTPAGSVAAPTFTGNGATLTGAISWPAGVPTTANESAHTHNVTTNVAVADHGAHTHTFVASSTNATPDLVTTNTAGSGVSPAGTTGNPNATLTHTVTNNVVASAAGSAHNHTVTWPAGVPTLAMNSYTPAGTNNAPAFTGTPAEIIPPYYAVHFWERTA